MYKYILWDLDGTILNFIHSQNLAIRALFNRYGLGECSDEMLKAYTDINHKSWAALERGEVEKESMLVNRFVEFFGLYNLDVSLASAFNRDYQTELGEYVAFEDGAKEVLDTLKNKYRHLLVTNGTKIAQTKKLRTSELDLFFDGKYISEDIGYEKPAEEYFEHLFVNENITDRSEAIIIGDSLSSDIQGGNNAGIDTCWYNPEHKEYKGPLNITYEIHDLRELLNIL